MIPLMAVVRVRTRRSHHLRLWLPLFLAWLLFLPLALLLLPIVFVVCLVYSLNPFRVFSTGWFLAAGLTGTRVEVEHGNASVLVNIF
jgi:hypothetical protein